MTTALARLLERRRLIVACALLLALVGFISWQTMPREEDPQFPHRTGLVLTAFPGADAETVERLVVEPLEEEILEVEGVFQIESTARTGFSLLAIELEDTVYDTASVWQDVEDAIDEARREFPSGVLEPELEDDLVSQDSIILAIGGSQDPLRLADAAKKLERGLISVPGVKSVEQIADPEEQITIEYDDETARRLDIDPRELAQQLSGRARIVPGGVIHLGSRIAPLLPNTEFESVAEILDTQILLPSGSAIPLRSFARVRQGPEEPAGERMRWNGERVVGLGVVPRDGIDRVDWGRAVRDRLEELRPAIAPLTLEEVIFQPAGVELRLADLSRSLGLGILIVAAVLFAAMGVRMGTLVALVVPMVAFGAIGIFAMSGGILHQISIAALVIALGMLVDNAIVMAEAIQWRLDEGEPAASAAANSVRELALPLGSATGTTLAAFVPMALSKGNTADFTRAIPTLIMLTLVVSYLFAVMVTPVLSELFLKARSDRDHSLPRVPRVARLGVERPGWVLLGALALLVFTGLLSGLVPKQFFPAADANVVLLELEMPEGTHVEHTSEVAERLERALAARPEVTDVASFVGRATPHFYYNLLSRPNSPHRADVVALTHSLGDVAPVIAWAREWLPENLPEAEVVARQLEQGPPIAAPIELRAVGEDLGELEEAAEAVLGLLRSHPATRDVRHTMSLGAPTVQFTIDDAAAGRFGLNRADVALSLQGRTLGTPVGFLRTGADPVPILVRSSAGERFPPSQLPTLDVAHPGGPPVPLGQIAHLGVEWKPSAIQHRNGERLARVRAQVAPGHTAAAVLGELETGLAALPLPAGVRLEIGGELEESGQANTAILRAMPIGVLLLLFFLLAEFNSFRRVALVLVTVPLAATGVVPGLLISGHNFGFMALLGVIALVGIVVNNAIVLLDVIEQRREEGADIPTALNQAIDRRLRPILLTAGTTVAGLSPLAFSASSLWPPLAWSMISGLVASTILTLLVVPALYRVLFRDPKQAEEMEKAGGRGKALISAALVVVTLLAPTSTPAEARDWSLEEVVTAALERPAGAAVRAREAAIRAGASAERRAVAWPSVGTSFDWTRRDSTFALSTPLGSFTLGDRTIEAVGVEAVQPLFDPAGHLFTRPAAALEADAAGDDTRRDLDLLALEALRAYTGTLAIEATIEATQAFVDSLTLRLEEIQARVRSGRTLEADQLKIQLELESALLELDQSRRQWEVARFELGRLVGEAGPIDPEPLGEPARIDRELEVLLGEADSRADLAALRRESAAAELRAKAIGASNLPVLEARGRWSKSKGDPLRPDEVAEAALVVRWVPFAAGTRAPRRLAQEERAAALSAELAERQAALRSEVRSALATLEDAHQAIEVRRRGVELAQETRRVEAERYGAGRSTTNDLLEAEAAVRQQQTLLEIARLRVVDAEAALDLVVGRTPGLRAR